MLNFYLVDRLNIQLWRYAGVDSSTRGGRLADIAPLHELFTVDPYL